MAAKNFVLRSEIDHINFIFYIICNSIEKLHDFSREFLLQAFMFLLLEPYKMLISLLFVDLKAENETVTI